MSDINPGLEDVHLLWAKLGSGPFAQRHPLLWHLIDVGMVARCLWKTVFRDQARRRFAGAVGLDDEEAGCWVAFLASLHDIGKATPHFQGGTHAGMADARAALDRAGFEFKAKRGCDHGTASAAIIRDLLSDDTKSWNAVARSFSLSLGIAVGGHHGDFPRSSGLRDLNISYGSQWNAAWRVLAQQSSHVFVNHSTLTRPDRANIRWVLMLLAGLTSVSDWIASNTDHFPHDAEETDVTNYAAIAAERAATAVQSLGWNEWHACSGHALEFEALFPECVPPRPLQRAVVEQTASVTGPFLMLIEAPMGEGKTEAALYLADWWNHRLGGQGTYVAMPTMATSNQMFERVVGFLSHRYRDGRINTHLVHGTSILSEQYDKLQSASAADVYNDNEAPAPVVAEDWFARNKKRAMLAPVAVGTVDQALLSVLRVKHVFVRLFGLAGKIVIVDEVHAYDTYTSAILDRLLEWLQALGCSVVLLSATLPKERRKALLNKWITTEDTVDPSYPRLTLATRGRVSTRTFNADPARRNRVEILWKKPDGLTSELETALRGGGCVAVVRNTVADAQQTYLRLKEHFSDSMHAGDIAPGDKATPRIDLFHARFVADDRETIERRVLDSFGPTSLRPQRSILVATQVIEQSLDLDFDLLVTDLAPMDLLIQRAGRLHRHRRDSRSIKEPSIWLIEPSRVNEVPVFGASEHVYDRYVLLRSFLSLCPSGRLRSADCRTRMELPDEIDELVQWTYCEPGVLAQLPQAWLDALELARSDAARIRLDEELKAYGGCGMQGGVVIDTPDGGSQTLADCHGILDEENPDAHERISAATRSGSPPISYVLWPEDWPEPTRPRSVSDIKRILRRSVAINSRKFITAASSATTPECWEQTLLERHRLLRLFPDQFSYDERLGLTLTT